LLRAQDWGPFASAGVALPNGETAHRRGRKNGRQLISTYPKRQAISVLFFPEFVQLCSQNETEGQVGDGESAKGFVFRLEFILSS